MILRIRKLQKVEINLGPCQVNNKGGKVLLVRKICKHFNKHIPVLIQRLRIKIKIKVAFMV